MPDAAPDTGLFAPLTLARGPAWSNRIALAPLTNTQSHDDGTLSDDEHRWLTMRAEGGFGLVMTCAAHVQAGGQGFPGQLGVWSDDHLPGLTRLAGDLRAAGAVSSVQLHHGGIRSPQALVGTPLGPSDDAETGARAMTGDEVEALVADFAAAAARAERAGFDGVEVHGAHGYVIAQFLSPELNRRDDAWGGSLEGRARLLLEVVRAIRAATGPDLQVGVRLSPERFGLRLPEIREVAEELARGGAVDYLDLSLWDVRKEPEDEAFRGRSLLSWFTGLDRGDVALGVAGKVRTGGEVRAALDEGADFVLAGRAAILHHDLPRRIAADPDFAPIRLPVTAEHLAAEGLGPAFVDYMRGWAGFVA